MLRKPEPPPPSPPPSVALLTALGYLQDLRDGDAVDQEELASTSRSFLGELVALIDRAEERGYLRIDDDGAIRLTQKGWRWYETYNPDR